METHFKRDKLPEKPKPTSSEQEHIIRSLRVKLYVVGAIAVVEAFVLITNFNQ